MAKPKRFSHRHNVRFDDALENALLARAGDMSLETSVYIRLVVERAVLDRPITLAPDRHATDLLRKWARRFERPNPADHNWDSIKKLVQETNNYLEEGLHVPQKKN